MSRWIFGMFLCLVLLSSCLSGSFPFIVFNTLQKPIQVEGLSEAVTIEPGYAAKVFPSLKEGTTFTLMSEGKPLQSFTVGQAELATPKDGVLFIAGGPHSFAIADYSSFYGDTPNTEIKDVQSLRKTQFYALKANEEVWLPEVGKTKLPAELVEGKTLKRVVPVPPQVPEKLFAEYLNAEFNAFKAPAAGAPAAKVPAQK